MPEKKCSECGKICGSTAKDNMKGEFSEWVLCGLCWEKYREILSRQCQAV